MSITHFIATDTDRTAIHGIGTTADKAVADAMAQCRDLTGLVALDALYRAGLVTVPASAALVAEVEERGGCIVWAEIDGVAVTVDEAAATEDSTTYRVTDGNARETATGMAALLDLIAEWYEDSAEWTTGTATAEEHQRVRDSIASVARPNDGCSLDQAQEYADAICEALAKAGGAEDWHGHGTYSVSAADSAGLSLSITVD